MKKNLGLARELNIGIQRAATAGGIPGVLLLDQDTRVDRLVRNLLAIHAFSTYRGAVGGYLVIL